MNPLRAEFDAIIAEYRATLPQKVSRLEQLLEAGSIAELRRELHTLAGSAGTFGLPQVGAAARAAE
ncbi:MAG: Hpt domain-containing protein, partial [Burkholderiales bacterium]